MIPNFSSSNIASYVYFIHWFLLIKNSTYFIWNWWLDACTLWQLPPPPSRCMLNRKLHRCWCGCGWSGRGCGDYVVQFMHWISYRTRFQHLLSRSNFVKFWGRRKSAAIQMYPMNLKVIHANPWLLLLDYGRMRRVAELSWVVWQRCSRLVSFSCAATTAAAAAVAETETDCINPMNMECSTVVVVFCNNSKKKCQ